MNSNKSRFRAASWPHGRYAAIAVSAAILATVILTRAPLAEPEATVSALQPIDRIEQTEGILLAYDSDGAEDLADKVAVVSGYNVTVRADGVVTVQYVTRSDCVADILERAGIALGPEDQLSHMPGRTVDPGDEIVVERWTRDTYICEEEIPPETELVPTSLVFPGKQVTLGDGVPGVMSRVYSRVLRDGEVMEQVLESETVLLAPVSSKVLVGTDCAPISPFDFEWELEDGKPVGYADVLYSQRAAGYSAKPGAGTASGMMKATAGVVAVNPNVIPYGTKLYIQSADGRFVYGYAIAADTGTALMQGIIGVDLFYNTRAESKLNSIRTVDIYILEYPEGYQTN